MAKDNRFSIVLDKWYQGYSPAYHLNSSTSLGNAGMATAMTNVDVLVPDYITQGPALATLTNGNQTGAATELINYILDVPPTDSVTYGVGPTKLFKITPTTVTSDGTWPHAITNCTDGESVAYLRGNLYYFYNKSSGGDIGKYNLDATFDDDWGSTVPSGAAALQKAAHPHAEKEDLMVFGNGRYLGVYTDTTATIEPTKLDFGNNYEVVDVVFSGNYWYIAVNSGVSGTNRSVGQIYLYDAGATKSILYDETGVGIQKIGCLYVLNGIIYVIYQDLTETNGYHIGYITGRQIKELVSFSGSLPNFGQKTMYRKTMLFASSGNLMSFGAVSPELPLQISNLADGGYTTLGAVAAPFGTPMVASTESSSYKIAKFSGLATACNWTGTVMPVGGGRTLGYIDDVIVRTNSLGANARADVTLYYNQSASNSGALSVTTTAKTKHTFKVPKADVEDIKVYIDWSNGNSTNPCNIKSIDIVGHYIQR